MNHQLEGPAIAQSNSRKMTHVARRQPVDAEQLGERYYRAVYQAEAEIREASSTSIARES